MNIAKPKFANMPNTQIKYRLEALISFAILAKKKTHEIFAMYWSKNIIRKFINSNCCSTSIFINDRFLKYL